MPTPGYVYLLTSRRNGTLYTGVTSDLARRVAEHRSGAIEGFTKEYGVHWLVYVEAHDDVQDAIRREKQIKKWRRFWKLRLIETDNPGWRDLYADWCEALTQTRPVRNPTEVAPKPSATNERRRPPVLGPRLRGDDSLGGDDSP